MLLNSVFAVENFVQRIFGLACWHVGKKSQAAHVDANNRYLLLSYSACGFQKGAVAPQREGQLGIEVVACERC